MQSNSRPQGYFVGKDLSACCKLWQIKLAHISQQQNMRDIYKLDRGRLKEQNCKKREQKSNLPHSSIKNSNIYYFLVLTWQTCLSSLAESLPSQIPLVFIMTLHLPIYYKALKCFVQFWRPIFIHLIAELWVNKGGSLTQDPHLLATLESGNERVFCSGGDVQLCITQTTRDS